MWKTFLPFTCKCIFILTNDKKGLQAKPSVSSSIYPGGKLCLKGPSLMPTNYCPTWEQQIILNNNENSLVKTSHILENFLPRQRYVQNFLAFLCWNVELTGRAPPKIEEVNKKWTFYFFEYNFQKKTKIKTLHAEGRKKKKVLFRMRHQVIFWRKTQI